VTPNRTGDRECVGRGTAMVSVRGEAERREWLSHSGLGSRPLFGFLVIQDRRRQQVPDPPTDPIANLSWARQHMFQQTSGMHTSVQTSLQFLKKKKTSDKPSKY
jgi:hypothetical protein